MHRTFTTNFFLLLFFNILIHTAFSKNYRFIFSKAGRKDRPRFISAKFISNYFSLVYIHNHQNPLLASLSDEIFFLFFFVASSLYCFTPKKRQLSIN
jgi:hypothetical protein